MHSGRSCQLRRTAGAPGVARGRIGRPGSRDSRSTHNKATINKREIEEAFVCLRPSSEVNVLYHKNGVETWLWERFSLYQVNRITIIFK